MTQRCATDRCAESGRDVRGSAVDDTGSVLLLTIGLVVVAVLAAVVVIDASAAFLQRRQLAAWADTAALAGAQGIDLEAYYAEGASSATRLDSATVVTRVRRHLAVAPDDVRIEQLSSDGRQVRLVLSAPLRLPFVGGLAPAGVLPDTVVVESRAQLAYRSAAGQPGP